MNIEKEKNNEERLILKALPEDIPAVQELIELASKGMYELCGWTPDDISKHFLPKKSNDMAVVIEEKPAFDEESDILFVSKDSKGKVIGCCFASKQKDQNRIEAIYIEPEYQGKGLAKSLYNEAFKKIDQSKDTFLDVFSLNAKGVNFYKKLGFIETGKKFFNEKYSNSKGDVLEITEMVLKTKKSPHHMRVGRGG